MTWHLVFCPQCHRRVEARVVAVETDDEGFSWDVLRCDYGGHLIHTNRFP